MSYPEIYINIKISWVNKCCNPDLCTMYIYYNLSKVYTIVLQTNKLDFLVTIKYYMQSTFTSFKYKKDVLDYKKFNNIDIIFYEFRALWS